jgi:hypothetical protein
MKGLAAETVADHILKHMYLLTLCYYYYYNGSMHEHKHYWLAD